MSDDEKAAYRRGVRDAFDTVNALLAETMRHGSFGMHARGRLAGLREAAAVIGEVLDAAHEG